MWDQVARSDRGGRQVRGSLPSAGSFSSRGLLKGGVSPHGHPLPSGQVTSLLETHRAAQDPAACSRAHPQDNRPVHMCS